MYLSVSGLSIPTSVHLRVFLDTGILLWILLHHHCVFSPLPREPTARRAAFWLGVYWILFKFTVSLWLLVVCFRLYFKIYFISFSCERVCGFCGPPPKEWDDLHSRAQAWEHTTTTGLREIWRHYKPRPYITGKLKFDISPRRIRAEIYSPKYL